MESASDALGGRFSSFCGFEVKVGIPDDFGERLEEIRPDVDSAVGSRGEDVAESWGVLFCGGVNEEDGIGVSGEARDESADALDIIGCMESFFEADGDLRGEFAIGLIEGMDAIDDEVWFAAAAVNFAGDDDDIFAFDDVFVAGIVFGPGDTADDSGGIFEVEVGVAGVSVAAGFFGGGEFDGGDHAADGDLGAVFEFGDFGISIGGVAFDASGVLSEWV
ncbi:MAG: hypothetical protein RL215_1390 [Planctomycetota bacterium]